MLPQKVKDLLDSSEIELVRLGATLLPIYAPREQWESILDKFSIDGTVTSVGTVTCVGGELYIRKWLFKIIEDEINILERTDVINLWAMHKKVDSPLLEMSDFKSKQLVFVDDDKFTWRIPNGNRKNSPIIIEQ